MNTKIAKRLRKESNYHPSQPREYTTINKSRKTKTKRLKLGQGQFREVSTGQLKDGTRELVDSDPRVLYKELKKEYYNPS